MALTRLAQLLPAASIYFLSIERRRWTTPHRLKLPSSRARFPLRNYLDIGDLQTKE